MRGTIASRLARRAGVPGRGTRRHRSAATTRTVVRSPSRFVPIASERYASTYGNTEETSDRLQLVERVSSPASGGTISTNDAV